MFAAVGGDPFEIVRSADPISAFDEQTLLAGIG